MSVGKRLPQCLYFSDNWCFAIHNGPLVSIMLAYKGELSMPDSNRIQPIEHVKVSGGDRERGQLLGEAVRHRIEHSLDTYQQLFALCGISWQQATEKGMRYFDQTLAFSPGFVEELEGVAKGSGIDFDSLFTLNSRTEILPPDFLALAVQNASPENVLVGKAGSDASAVGNVMSTNECTSLATESTESTDSVWLAQNWDWCGTQRQALCLVDALTDSGLRYFTVTEAGMLAKIGLNSAGFAVTLNILRSRDDGHKPGIPVHVLLRRLLNCESVAEARQLVGSTRFSSSSNVMVADRTGDMASFELSPAGCKILEAANGHLCHTNHFLHDDLIDDDVGRIGNQSTINRFSRSELLISDSMSFKDIEVLLCDQSDGLESICRFPDLSLPAIAQIETVCSVIMNLTNRTLAVSGGQPSVSDYLHYSFTDIE